MRFSYIEKESQLFGKILAPFVYIEVLSRHGLWCGINKVLVDTGADITFILDHSDEMKPEDVKRLVQYKNCIIYPPIAYLSKEGRIIKQKIFVENMENFLKGNPTNKVN